ncbi:MAG: sugar phosphate isomerase/epimerase [Lachnospiraceae bacterium]|nr:sugar phosphate isomerase/epimerase [Lachnospiraceae bacterium]
MQAKWSINPDFNDLDRFIELSKQYDTAFEYIDFTYPKVYQSAAEMRKRIETYKALDRDHSKDTLHGVFYDIALISTDDVIRERSRYLAEMSLSTARDLACKGVVFHTGILGGLNVTYYLEGWVDGMCEYLPTLLEKYEDLEIYLENTVESSPKEICEVAERLKKYRNFKLCLDYAHASITQAPVSDWVEAMAPYVGHIHLNDNDLRSDLHLAAGDGDIDLRMFKAGVEHFGFDVNILLEVSGYDKAKRSLEYMSAL